MQHSELRVALPPGGHLMTLEGTEDNRTLVRIENIHQDLTVNVSVTHLLHSFLLLDACETMLSAHQYRSEVQRRPWTQTEGKYVAPDESAYLMQQVHGNMLVNIQPGQIRTFLAALKAFSLPPASRVHQ
ncbi:lysosomal alpha-mannosidase-like [Rhipicephalus microplus]|uniref:lysosomal alpha-mannosidase-like n=1 Tax=Rhipicephalus microplus TaxID=6941 RepID=UPI003F6CFAC4